MNRPVTVAVLLALTGPAFAQAPGPIAPGVGSPGAGRTAIDPLTARPGVTAPDGPLYDPVTGMPTQARVVARGRAGSALNPPPPPNPDPFGAQSIPGLPSRSGLANAPAAVDPFTAQPGVQQMRTGTYDPYASRPGGQQTQPGGPQAGYPTQPGFPGQGGSGGQRPYGTYGATAPNSAGTAPGYPSGGYPNGGNPNGGYPGGGYGGNPPALDPYTGSPTDKYSYGRR